MSKDFESLMEEAISNVRADREKTDELLKDLIAYIANGPDRHKEVGFTLAKYLETLQRSNEQLVKLTALMKKNTEESSSLSELDRDKIFEGLKGSIALEEPKKKAKSK